MICYLFYAIWLSFSCNLAIFFMRKLSIHIHVYLLFRYYLPTLHLRIKKRLENLFGWSRYKQKQRNKKGWKTASMHVAHFCKTFSFFSGNPENYQIDFFPFYFHFVSRKQTRLQVLLKLAQWFWRRRWTWTEKLTTMAK